MNKSRYFLKLFLYAYFALFAVSVRAGLVINEFMAINDTTFADEDDDYSDWIELKNNSSNTVDLTGWYLTDDEDELDKWQFPATNIQPGAFMVIFASDKDRSVAGSELHTNFKLSGDGEYLGIIQPDGESIEYAYSPVFPPQVEDLSYGIVGGTTDIVLIEDDAPCCAFVPTDSAEGNDWLLQGFDDSAWTFGNLGVGYENSSGYETLFDIDLKNEMYGINASAYIRVPFVFPENSDALSLTLRMKYDDGFIIYINGTEVASENAPASPSWNSQAVVIHNDSLATTFVTYDLTTFKHLLTPGHNMLAIHALNCPASSSDLLMVPELECRIESGTASSAAGYLQTPTPGSANTTEILMNSEAVIISEPGHLCSGPVIVELSAPVSAEKIYYTLDGSEPSIASSEYTGPITISTTTSLRARSFETGLALGTISSETYLFLDSSVSAFTSDLPIVVVDNLGGGDIPYDSSQSAFIAFFEQGIDNRTHMTSNFVLSARAGIRRRGESSLRATNNKPNLAVETWKPEDNNDYKIKPFEMPAESDWILWAPYYYDRAGLRNAFIYDISNQSGDYAVRTRFVEVFLNAYGGNVTMDDYAGMYVFMEKIKRDNDRVDIEAMTPYDNEEPAVSGGYIMRIDKTDPDQNLLSGMVQQNLYCIDPLPADITPQQESWITDFIIDFEAQLNNTNESTGYPAYIDQDAFIDHNIFNMLTKNADGLRLSTYMSKQRNGKLAMGPIWDFDRAIDSLDDRDNDPLEWAGRDYCYIAGTDSAYWWKYLFKNADFWQKYIDRWTELRQNVLSDTNVSATIDAMAGEIAEARARDIARWHQYPRTGSNGLDGTQQGEVNYMKWWLTTRMNWIDSQLITPPIFSVPGEKISSPVQLTISIPSGTTAYYTTDGSDPRAPGGNPSSTAIAYTAPITVNPGTLIRARAWDGTSWAGNPPDEIPWSSMTEAVFQRSTPAMFITEIHYNPASPEELSSYDNDDFEFIELLNVSGETIDLQAYKLDGGIEYSFSTGDSVLLPADEYVILVRNQEAFASRYNTNGMFIAGEYTGNLSNSGDDIRLEFYDQKVFQVSYDDSRGWPCAADGGGPSLIPDTGNLEIQGFDILDYPGCWRASTYIGGSPGEADPDPQESILINEITAHTDTGEDPPFDSNDQIELFNPTESPVTLDSCWYMSDDLENPEKWNIPAGTVIPSKGWVLFDEDDFHPGRISGFGLDKAGELLFLAHLPGAAADCIVDCISFKGQANGSSLGRYPDGNKYMQTLMPTPGTANQLPGPGIRIQEIMYNPMPVEDINEDDVLEYILLTNASSATIVFNGVTDCTNTWRFTGGIEYSFAPDTHMDGDERLWLVPFDPLLDADSKTLFCTTYGLSADTVRLLGPYNGDLSDSGERIALEQPQSSDDPDAPDDISWIIIDEVIWLDEFPWPAGADGTGLALARTGSAGNDPLSWTLSEYSGPKYIVTYERLSPGVATWDGFTKIPNLSSEDYADIHSDHDIVVSVPMGTLQALVRPGLTRIEDGFGQQTAVDNRLSMAFTDNSAGRIGLDMGRIIPVSEINSYSWLASGYPQNQNYDLYYSTASNPPAAGADITDLSSEGWMLLGSVQSVYDISTDGQIGVNIRSRFSDTLLYARHLLWDIKENSTYYCEFDVYMSGFFVTNNIPSVWLNSHGLEATDAAALNDSDGDGLLNWEEFYAGTDPNSSTSVFRITGTEKCSTQHTIKWKAVSGKTYALQFKPSLTSGEWTTVRSGITASEPECSCSLEVESSSGFIRILVE